MSSPGQVALVEASQVRLNNTVVRMAMLTRNLSTSMAHLLNVGTNNTYGLSSSHRIDYLVLQGLAHQLEVETGRIIRNTA